jgi:hypothetical protein
MREEQSTDEPFMEEERIQLKEGTMEEAFMCRDAVNANHCGVCDPTEPGLTICECH